MDENSLVRKILKKAHFEETEAKMVLEQKQNFLSGGFIKTSLWRELKETQMCETLSQKRLTLCMWVGPLLLLSWTGGCHCIRCTAVFQAPTVILLEGRVLLVLPGDRFFLFWCHTTGVHTEWLALPSLYLTQRTL